VKDKKELVLVGVGLVCFSDWLDGFIARRFKQSSVLGAFIDPLADKIVIGSLCCGLALKGLLPIPLAAVVVGRDVLILAAGLVVRAREMPPGSFFFDTTSTATFEATPSTLSKVKSLYYWKFYLFSPIPDSF
jgi:cardiolipin synthase